MRKEIFRLAIPNILTNLTVPLVSLVDLGLMGRMPSASYILAIGFGTLIFNFSYWAFGFLRMGTTGMVSQSFGKGDKKQAESFLLMGLSISSIVGILFIILQYPVLQLGLYLIQPELAVIEPLSTYFYYRIYAAPATISIFVISGWLLGMQDSKSALYLAIIINGINAITSFILVSYTSLAIAGIAIGTIIAQYSGLVFGIILILKNYKIEINVNRLLKSSNFGQWSSFLKVNSDIFIRTLCLIGVMSFFKTKAGNIDPILGAANILLLEFVTIAAFGIDGFAFAAESICGKYFGQNNRKKLMQAIKHSFLLGFMIALLISGVFYFFGKLILNLLTDKVEIIEAALPYLYWLAAMPIISSFAFIWDGIYIGVTSSKAMRNSMILSTFLVFLPLFYFLEGKLENHGMWLSFLIFLFARGVFQTFLAPKAVWGRLT